jgi:hypothetical protein
MPILGIFQGHWRALESVWLLQFRQAAASGTAAVVTAGQPLTSHLLSIIPESVGGVSFFPGIPALAKSLSSSVTGSPVPKSLCIALACLAGYKPESAPAASAFFEKLIETGVSSLSFSVIAQSTKGLHEEVHKTALKYLSYSSRRNALCPSSPDRITEAGPKNPTRFNSYMFYGFYDLNPAQRSYVKQLSKTAAVTWFSPVHPSHHWRSAFERTQSFLMGLGCSETHRVDFSEPLSPNAQFAENLLTGKALLKNDGITLLLSGSGSAFVKAVADQAVLLGSKYGNDKIAIVSTGDESRLLTRQLHAMNIACAVPLTVPASALPSGRLLSRLLELESNSFHHCDIEKILLTGAVAMKNTPDASVYASQAAKLGARFGLPALRETQFPFAEAIADYFETLPLEAEPCEYLRRTSSLLALLTENSVPDQFTESVLKGKNFTIPEIVSFDVFKQMISTAMEADIQLQESQADGIAVISPEKIRGTLKKALIITGLEEGAFPRSSVSDPRLPLEIKKQLQLPLPDARETEEAFLLRQVFEAALSEIVIISRNTDNSGRSLALSPFLSPLLEKNSPVKPIELSDSPVNVLHIPANPPFLRFSTAAQREKLGFDPENPAPSAIHSGMIGTGLFSVNRLSATLLENYARDPFGFLISKVWKVEEAAGFPVRSEPDYRLKGIIVHACVQKALQSGVSAADAVREICLKYGLSTHLGSETLASIWKEHLVAGISSLTEMLGEMQWTFAECEKSLTGTIAGLPAEGRIDLIFKCPGGGWIVADLKTGKPQPVTADKLIQNNLFQLPFYRNLAVQNGYTPFTAATYIHIESCGEITFKTLGNNELENINGEFEERVLQLVESISMGVFPEDPEKQARWHQK